MGNVISAKKYVRNFLIIVLLFSSLFTSAQYNSILFNNVGINQGLSQSSVVDITFDSKGFTWLATQDGLNRYDGKEFLITDKKFDDITSGFNNRLGKVAPAEGDFLWVISKGGCLEKFNLTDGTFTPINIQAGKVKQVITCLQADENGKLWIGTAEGKLILYDSRLAKVMLELSMPVNVDGPAINALYKDNSKRLWILGSTLCYLQDKRINQFDTGNDDDKVSYSSMSEDGAGNLWLGSWGNGIFLKRMNEHHFRQFNGYEKAELSSSLVIETMLTDHGGKTWFGTYGDGLFIVDDKTATVKQLVNNKRIGLCI